MTDQSDLLPRSIRYVKLGEGGKWWRASKERNELHAGWSGVPSHLIASRDMSQIAPLIRDSYGAKRGATQDLNMLASFLNEPSRHVWITFEDGFLWWCTVSDSLVVSEGGSTPQAGHFWLQCDRPWSNRSLGGRMLATADLPGTVTATAGYRATTCEPRAATQIARIIRDEIDPDVAVAQQALLAHRRATASLVRRLSPKDFELLVDLILSRSGWVRIAKLGGAIEGIDVEAEHAATEEIAFVQVKSAASQSVLDDYVSRFLERRDRYDRMIFAVHSPRTALSPPSGLPIQVWDGERIADLAVRLGFAEWLAQRF